jgi:hypothetical protein
MNGHVDVKFDLKGLTEHSCIMASYLRYVWPVRFGPLALNFVNFRNVTTGSLL